MSEDDWMKRWRKNMPPGPWAFPDIEELMKEMQKEFMQFEDIEKDIPKELVRERKAPDGSVKREIGPIVYGYSMTIGPDGKPVVREFGNVKRGVRGPMREAITETREPMVDVVDSDKEVRVIVELPGAKKQDVDLTVENQKLTVSVNTPQRKYHKVLDLPSSVVVEGSKSNFNNGILEVIFPKKPGSQGGVRIKVE
jgi:HSP20 family protein